MSAPRRQQNTIRPVILLMVVIFFIASGYLLFNFYNESSLSEITAQRVARQNVIKEPVVENLPITSLQTDQYYELSDKYFTEYAEQVGVIAEQYPSPSLPRTIKIEDTAIGNSVYIYWQAPLEQTYDAVEIYRSQTETSIDTQVAVIPKLEGTFIDTGLENNTTYYYSLRTVRTVDGQEYVSAFSEIIFVTPSDSTPPAPPQNVAVERDLEHSGDLLISWDQITDTDVKEIRVRRSIVAGEIGDVLETVDVTYNQLRDSTVDQGVAYYYTVTAVDASGNESATRLLVAAHGNDEPFLGQKSAEQALYPERDFEE